MSPERLSEAADAMAGSLVHRGPDGHGTWTDAEAGVGFGHRRLSVIDLSAAGHQPMVSADNRYVLNYNGELYNAPEIKKSLVPRDVALRGHSDTEILLEAIARHGVAAALRAVNGMFAFSVWDRRSRELVLARDRLGEKPLYYAWSGRRLVFGSELRSLRLSECLSPEIDPRAVALYMRHGFIPAPWTIYTGVHKLPPGHLLRVDARGATDLSGYWELPLDEPDEGSSDRDATDTLEALLADSTRGRLAADVPVGAFLSGGVDSSLTAALMQAHGRGRAQTFTIGFDAPDYDESRYARAVANHLGTEHTEHIVSVPETLETIPRLPFVFDEPFADSSQIPVLLMCELARRHVTVALSGDGGDELFSGYERYGFRNAVWNRIHTLPPFARRALASGVAAVRPDRWDAVATAVTPVLPKRLRMSRPGQKIHRFGRTLQASSPEAAYVELMSLAEDSCSAVRSAVEPETVLSNPQRWPRVAEFAERLAIIDTLFYLPDDLLVKVDRASMAVSLEVRLPLLDHRIVEFSRRLPFDQKVRGGQRKWLLRQVLQRYLPLELVDRPKMGFGVPIGAWLRGPLRPWAEDHLSREALETSDLLDPVWVRRRWHEHVAGTQDRQHVLWAVLMLQSWLQAQHPVTHA